LNLGCPQGIARKGRYGAFLMKEKQIVQQIVSTLSNHLKIPVTVKIRIFPDVQETLSFCDMLQEAGADLLTVHGRTKEMNKTAVRECDWKIIRQIKQRLKIPVLANGGIETFEDIESCLKITQADGVMSSEAFY
jgi:tRNA-dihydrouridine synthase 1